MNDLIERLRAAQERCKFELMDVEAEGLFLSIAAHLPWLTDAAKIRREVVAAAADAKYSRLPAELRLLLAEAARVVGDREADNEPVPLGRRHRLRSEDPASGSASTVAE
jgi:hypothetical protein